MESTGCKGCDKEQEITGDRTAMCIPCQIDAEEYVITAAMNRIEELKQLMKNGRQSQSHSSMEP